MLEERKKGICRNRAICPPFSVLARTRTAAITPGDPAMPTPGPSRWPLALFAFALGSLSTLALVGGAYYTIYRRPRQSQSPPQPPQPVYSRLNSRTLCWASPRRRLSRPSAGLTRRPKTTRPGTGTSRTALATP